MATLPIGVVVPTRNSAPFLPEHLAAMRQWLDLVREVVVVDSFSTDGTLDLLKAGLPHPQLAWVNHPPGLYQSWNCGVAQISAEYVYIATIGDTITRSGLQRLYETAQSLAVDVVISKPDFVDPQGQPLPDLHWPIDDIIAGLRLTRPCRLERLQALVFAITNLSGALSGSCASNLFRTQALRRHPFPAEFGNAGDGAWSILHAADLRWAVVPERFSRFLRHPSTESAAAREAAARAPRWHQVADQAIAAGCKAGLFSHPDLARLGIPEILHTLTTYLDRKEEFDRQRKAPFPWIFNPGAWRTRVRRNRAQARLEHLRTAACRAVVAPDAAPASHAPRASTP